MGSTKLSAHLQTIRSRFAEMQAYNPLEDKYPPNLPAVDGPIVAKLITPSISYYVTERVFVKRQPHEEELGMDVYGNPCVNPYIADRHRNEAAVLELITTRTKAPVPKFLQPWEQNGLVYLRTAFVAAGVGLDEIV